MKILKFIGIALLSIIGLLVVYSLFKSDKDVTTRTLKVSHSPAKVYNYLLDIKNVKKWNYWTLLDTAISIQYGESTIGSGAAYSWDSKDPNLGHGAMAYTTCVPNDSIGIYLDFKDRGTATSSFVLKPNGTGTEIFYSMYSDLSTKSFFSKIMHKIMGLFFTGMMNNAFDESLKNIDHNLSNISSMTSTLSSLQIEEMSVPAFFSMTVKGHLNMKDVAAKLGEWYGIAGKEAAAQKLNITGPPFAVYHEFSLDKDFKAEAGLTTDKKGKSNNGIIAKETPACRCVVGHHLGSYEATEHSHQALLAYIAAHKLTIAGPSREVYISDPMAEKDTSKWATDIFYPVK
jgi:effector-binding domain-containing protein/uncharacterized protein YndB with AHSA1/START domain